MDGDWVRERPLPAESWPLMVAMAGRIATLIALDAKQRLESGQDIASLETRLKDCAEAIHYLSLGNGHPMSQFFQTLVAQKAKPDWSTDFLSFISEALLKGPMGALKSVPNDNRAAKAIVRRILFLSEEKVRREIDRKNEQLIAEFEQIKREEWDTQRYQKAADHINGLRRRLELYATSGRDLEKGKVEKAYAFLTDRTEAMSGHVDVWDWVIGFLRQLAEDLVTAPDAT
jgi:hypothetical protein